MPTFPKYEGSVQVATPNTPMNPTESIAAKQLGELGKAAEGAGIAGYNVAQRFKYLRDVTDSGAAYQKSVAEQESFIETLKGENAVDARKKFNEFVQQRQGDWYKGLSKEAAFNLQHDLFPKLVENGGFASKVETRYHTDKVGATVIQGELQLQRAINTGKIQSDPAASDEFKQTAKVIDAAVASGLYTQKEGAEWKQRVLKNTSYDLAYRRATYAPEQFRKDYKEYVASKGEYVGENEWFKNIDAKELAVLDGVAKKTITDEANQAHTDKMRLQAEQDRNADIAREKYEGMMAEKLNKGQLKESDVAIYQRLDRVSGEKVNFWYAAARNELLTGGPGDPEVRRALGWEVANAVAGTRDNAQLEALRRKTERLAVAKLVPQDEALKYMFKLSEKQGAADSEVHRQTTEAKAILIKALTTTGQFEKPNGSEVDAQVKGMIALYENSLRPESERIPPLKYVQMLIPDLRAEAHPKGVASLQRARTQHGVGPSPKEGETVDAPVEKKKKEYLDSYNAAKTPEERRRALDNLKSLKRDVEDAEAANRKQKADRDEAKRLRDERKAEKQNKPQAMPGEQ